MLASRTRCATLALALLAVPAQAQAPFRVAASQVEDRKPVFATVESIREVEARTRIAGTLRSLGAREGDAVQAGQLLAEVEDPKLAMQLAALDARLAALAAQRRQAQLDHDRTRTLRAAGAATQVRLDETQTALDVVEAQAAASRAERAVVEQQQREGQVLAPQGGRVLRVRGTPGAVVQPGETLFGIATDHYVLRLRLPERHARFLRAGDAVEVGTRGLGDGVLGEGHIRLVYPQMQDGQVVADAEVAGLGDFFVGERVRVTVAADRRLALVVPAEYLLAAPGLDLVRLATGALVPVQRGPARDGGIEILSGLHAGDELVRP